MNKKVIFSMTQRLIFLIVICIAFFSILTAAMLTSYTNRTIFIERSNQAMRSVEELNTRFSNILDNTENLYYSLLSSPTVSKFLSDNKNSDQISSYQIQTHDILSEYITMLGLTPFIKKALIAHPDNLSVTCGTSVSLLSDMSVCLEQPYYTELISSPSLQWIGIKPDTFSQNTSDYLIPVVRPLFINFSQNWSGWIFIALDADKLLQDYPVGVTPDTPLYIWRPDSFFFTFPELTELPLKDITFEDNGFMLNTDHSFMQELVIQGIRTPCALTYCQSFDAYFIEPIEKHFISITEFPSSIFILLILVFIIIVVFLAIIFHQMLLKPLTRVNQKINRIALGDYTRDLSIESDNEIGMIGKCINDMANNIQISIRQKLEHEKEKNESRFALLQYQINPHFIYNTLNTIKWMADFQQAYSISEMTQAFTLMLKNISKTTGFKITIRQELEFLQNYLTVLSFRYQDKFTYKIHVADDSLYQAEILKFILQPLVENSIFHGLVPKKGIGHLNIYIKREDNDVVIYITDDGIGMSRSKINQLFENEPAHYNGFSKIGIQNIEHRLILEYGSSYGMTISSEEGKSTTFLIRYPLRYRKL